MTSKINARLKDYISELEKTAKEQFMDARNFKSDFIKHKTKDCSEYAFSFDVGEISYKFPLWYSKDGISHNISQGNNKEKQSVLEKIVKKVDSFFCRELKTISHTFTNVTEEHYLKLLEDFSKDIYSVELNVNNKHIAKIKLDKILNVTVTYFNSAKKILFQGKNTALWDNLFYYMSEKLNLNNKEIVETYLRANTNINSSNFEFSQELVVLNLTKSLGENVINNRKVILGSELELLKTTEQFLSLNMNTPDYSFMLVPSFRVIEGLLRRILDCNDIKDANAEFPKSFYQFHNEKNQLDSSYHYLLNNDTILIEIVNSLYTICYEHRNTYCHSDGVNPPIICSKENAIRIYNEICNILKKVSENINKLIKE